MVSVAMAFYNGKTYIEEQIDSILRNLKEKDELVISVDDASDGSDQILKKRAQADMRIRVVKGPGNGVVPNFQNALRHCRGCRRTQIWAWRSGHWRNLCCPCAPWQRCAIW